MPRTKKPVGLTHPRLPGKTYKTERGLKQALDMLDKKEAKQAKSTLTLSPDAQSFLAENPSALAEKPAKNPEETGKEATGPGPSFIRNNYHTEVSLRFERHESKRRIELKPRGQRGDLAPIQSADLNDPVLIDNVNLGLVELITAGEAAEIASKQTTNQRKVHPALAVLRNELGDEYDEDAIKVEIPFEQQGVVVAELEDGQVVVDRGGIRRTRVKGQEPGTPDYVVGAEKTHAPAGEEAAYLSDLRARRSDPEVSGPEAGLGGIKRVVVEQAKKVQ